MGSRESRGVALLIVLVLVALLAGLGVTIAGSARQSVKAVEQHGLYTQLHHSLLANEAKVLSRMTQEVESSPTGKPRPDDGPNFVPDFVGDRQIGPIFVQSTVTDLQGRFNLAELAAPGNARHANRILRIYMRYCTDIGVSTDIASALADIVGAEQLQGTSDSIPVARFYGWVRQLAVSTALDSRTLTLLLAHFTVLPAGTPVNVLSAPPALLLALTEQAQPHQIDEFVRFRTLHRDTTDASLSTHPLISALSHSGFSITFNSRFFEVIATASLGDDQRSLQSLIYRRGESGAAQILIRRTPERVPQALNSTQ